MGHFFPQTKFIPFTIPLIIDHLPDLHLLSTDSANEFFNLSSDSSLAHSGMLLCGSVKFAIAFLTCSTLSIRYIQTIII